MGCRLEAEPASWLWPSLSPGRENGALPTSWNDWAAMSETVAHLLAHVTCASQPGLASHGSAVVVPDLKAIASVEECPPQEQVPDPMRDCQLARMIGQPTHHLSLLPSPCHLLLNPKT